MKYILISLLFVSCIKQGHVCMQHCPYQGVRVFNKSIAQYPNHAASYTLDSLHIVHPELDYDQEIDFLSQNNIHLTY